MCILCNSLLQSYLYRSVMMMLLFVVVVRICGCPLQIKDLVWTYMLTNVTTHPHYILFGFQQSARHEKHVDLLLYRLEYFDSSLFRVHNSFEPSSLVNVEFLHVIVCHCFYWFMRLFSRLCKQARTGEHISPSIQARLLITSSIQIVSRLLACMHWRFTAFTSLVCMHWRFAAFTSLVCK